MLDRLELTYGVVDEGYQLVVEAEDGVAIVIGVTTIEDSGDREWPVLWVDLPVLMDVEESGSVDALDVAAANHALIIGKVAMEDGQISLQHEFVGWPGAAEYTVAIEALVRQRAMVRALLPGLTGNRPAAYSELVD